VCEVVSEEMGARRPPLPTAVVCPPGRRRRLHLAITFRWYGPGTREEPGTFTQGAPVFPGSSRLGIEPKTPGWLVQDPTTRPIGDLIPTIGGSVSCLRGERPQSTRVPKVQSGSERA
jgi:hypothetical protein